MLDKIVHIKNIGRFCNYSANGDVSFRKLTLFYAENGRGKTTFCAILRSLQSGQAGFITERRTLGVTDPPYVHIRLNGADYKFTNDAWTVPHPDIVIFDPVFINDNVYSGEYVEHEQKKNLYRVIVGPRGGELAEQIENFDRQIRDANLDLNSKKRAVENELPHGTTFEDYLRWKPVAEIETQILQKAEELSNRERASAKSDEIQAKELLAKVQLPSLPPDFATVLAKQLTDIVADADVKVRDQIAKHEMRHQGETWLSQGVDYVKDDLCPFCGQGVSANELIAAYRSYFSTTYRTLKQEIAQLSQRIDTTIGEKSLASAQKAVADNAALAEFWKQFVTIDVPDLSSADIQKRYVALREQCLALVKKKLDSPTEAVVADDVFKASLAAVDDLRGTADAYNKAVDTCNARIEEQKAAVQKEGDLAALQKELTLLEAKKRRFEQEVIEACQAYQDALESKARLEEQKRNVRRKLDEYCENIIRTYEQSINEYLDQFNAGFCITNTRHLYTGGTPSSQYQIKINNTAVDLGDARSDPGTPCFKTTLSAGDRGALALAFFLAVLKQDTNIARKIIVFDDPFTSLDRFRRTCTQQLILRLLDSAQQVIVLSHDPLFLKLLFDECSSAANNVKTLQMSKAGDTTVIGEWDVMAEAQSSYMKDFSTLLKFYRERRGDPRAVARTIRPFLEGMLRSHFPGHFLRTEWLGDFIGKIRAADTTSGLQHAKADLDELDAINSYSKKYHHQQNANADAEPINDDELHGYVKRTLRLVGGA